MSLELADTICKFRTYLKRTFAEDSVAAVDRLLKNADLLDGPADNAEIQAAIDLVKEKGQDYVTEQLTEHVDVLKALRDGDEAMDNPCKAVDSWVALSKLDDALTQLDADRTAGQFNAANRRRAMEAAGEAFKALGELMQASTALTGFGEFLGEFVDTAWIPLTEALGVYFERIQWLDRNFHPTEGYSGSIP